MPTDLPPGPLAFNTLGGRPLKHAGIFRDVNGRWWSVQGRDQHISFVRLAKQPEQLDSTLDPSNATVAFQLQTMLVTGRVQTFRTQDEADEAFKQMHPFRFIEK